ncbi:hypothetical protein CLV31_103203 [Algoriphagus aquaeductus]|uniref:Uncharacterized protein n=1 Tax=Algoriphagus aquaeductus TaxID=475299 RepID=A0A326RVH3_9BACT|nr:hypothetical protein CLV31_103203 [Algoriphagus aquaeductus]
MQPTQDISHLPNKPLAPTVPNSTSNHNYHENDSKKPMAPNGDAQLGAFNRGFLFYSC